MEIIRHGRRAYDVLYFKCPLCSCCFKEIILKCNDAKCKCPECGTMVDGIDEDAYKLYLELVGKSIFEG